MAPAVRSGAAWRARRSKRFDAEAAERCAEFSESPHTGHRPKGFPLVHRISLRPLRIPLRPLRLAQSRSNVRRCRVRPAGGKIDSSNAAAVPPCTSMILPKKGVDADRRRHDGTGPPACRRHGRWDKPRFGSPAPQRPRMEPRAAPDDYGGFRLMRSATGRQACVETTNNAALVFSNAQGLISLAAKNPSIPPRSCQRPG